LFKYVPLIFQRIAALQKFSGRFTETPAVKQELAHWEMEFAAMPVKMKGRTLPPQEIIQGGGMKSSYKIDNADWGNTFRSAKLLSAVACSKFAVVYPAKDEIPTKNFVKMLLSTCQGMSFNLGAPRWCKIENSNTASYAKEASSQNCNY
jgi:hypothetical protein